MGTVGHGETKGVTLDIDEGSFVIVIGTNGSGKSKLLNAAAGTFRSITAPSRCPDTTSRNGRNTAAPR